MSRFKMSLKLWKKILRRKFHEKQIKVCSFNQVINKLATVVISRIVLNKTLNFVIKTFQDRSHCKQPCPVSSTLIWVLKSNKNRFLALKNFQQHIKTHPIEIKLCNQKSINYSSRPFKLSYSPALNGVPKFAYSSYQNTDIFIKNYKLFSTDFLITSFISFTTRNNIMKSLWCWLNVCLW